MDKWLLVVGLSLSAAAPAYADSLRCGTHLITEGDTRSEVVAYCGEPTEVQQTTAVLRRPLVWVRGRPYTLGDNLIEIPVDVWLYNLGPSKLMRRLRFEDGRLVEIETLGYGYIDTTPRPAQ